MPDTRPARCFAWNGCGGHFLPVFLAIAWRRPGIATDMEMSIQLSGKGSSSSSSSSSKSSTSGSAAEECDVEGGTEGEVRSSFERECPDVRALRVDFREDPREDFRILARASSTSVSVMSEDEAETLNWGDARWLGPALLANSGGGLDENTERRCTLACTAACRRGCPRGVKSESRGSSGSSARISEAGAKTNEVCSGGKRRRRRLCCE